MNGVVIRQESDIMAVQPQLGLQKSEENNYYTNHKSRK
jgi:hypothetical protein